MKPEDHFHVGIVVEDHDETLRQLSAAFGYRWCQETDVTLPVWLPGGEQELRLRFSYSVEAPRLEIIHAVPGTPWMPAAGSGIHHLGYWSDDVAADADVLEQQGCEREASAMGPDGKPVFMYLRNPAGPRIELVNNTSRPFMEQSWATGGSLSAG